MSKNKEKPLPKYLTEKKLGIYLSELFPKIEFIHDKSVPNSLNKRRRPDYRSDDLMIILEFDGDSHYCKANRIIVDNEKNDDYANLGYKVFRIPYFVQLTTSLLQEIFGKEIQFEQKFPHGFIDPKATLPCDFCELGIEKFKKDLEKFKYHRDDIINSLKHKINEKGNTNVVIPQSLMYLIE